MSPTGDPTTYLSVPGGPQSPVTLSLLLLHQGASAGSRLRPSAWAVTLGAGLTAGTAPAPNTGLPEGVAAQVPAGWSEAWLRPTEHLHAAPAQRPPVPASPVSPRPRCYSRPVPRPRTADTQRALGKRLCPSSPSHRGGHPGSERPRLAVFSQRLWRPAAGAAGAEAPGRSALGARARSGHPLGGRSYFLGGEGRDQRSRWARGRAFGRSASRSPVAQSVAGT